MSSVPVPTLQPRSPGCTVVMRGGGVKGIALLGALEELEKHYRFDTFVGTSAGAITAVLLASGFSPGELKEELFRKDFLDFLDAHWLRASWNLLVRHGMYPGESLRAWLRELLEQKISTHPARLRDLPLRAVLFATNAGLGTLKFDSAGENRDAEADLAARLSMSIPYLFVPVDWSGRRTYDGGLINNFPLREYVRSNPESNFLALYLGARENPPVRQRPVFMELLSVWLSQDEPIVLNEFTEHTIVIDPSPITTVDFALSDEEKNHLLHQGRLAALQHLSRAGKLPAEDVQRLEALRQSAAHLKAAAVRTHSRRRSRSRRWRRLVGAGLIALSGAALGVANRPEVSDTEPVHEEKWIVEPTVLARIQDDIRNDRIAALPGYERRSRGADLQEIQIYFDTETFALKDAGINVFLKVFLRRDSCQGQWIFTRKQSAGVNPHHTWNRMETQLPIPALRLGEGDSVAVLASVAGTRIPAKLYQVLESIDVTPSQLIPQVVLGVHRKQWTYTSANRGDARRLQLQLTRVAALRYADLPRRRYLVSQILQREPVRWNEVEIEERGPRPKAPGEPSLWERLAPFRAAYGLREQIGGAVMMAKYHHALTLLRMRPDDNGAVEAMPPDAVSVVR